MNKEIKWYRLDDILKYKAQYYLIVGERSNGKTYATLQYLIDEYFQSGCTKQFAYIKRYEEDIKSKYSSSVFEHLSNYIREKYNHEVKFYRGQWLVHEVDSYTKIADCKVFGHAFSLSNSNRYKGTSYPNIENILFEEFMTMDCTYLPDEINLLLNLVSTIARNRIQVRVFMLANTISKFNPYFSALNLKVHRIEKGKIISKTFTDKKGFKTTFVIERTENVNVYDNSENKEKVVFNIFGNSGVGSMITTGDFEVHSYPQQIDGFHFEGNKGTKVISSKYKTSIVMKFEDYYYRLYLIDNHIKYIIAFREIEEHTIKEKNTTHIINGNTRKNIINVNNLASYDGQAYNEIFNIIVRCLRQKDFIVQSDDDGENVVNGFRMSGITYTHN